MSDLPPQQGLYDPAHERDGCGIGLLGRLDGRKTRKIVDDALKVLANLRHRGAKGYDAESGDGAGIMLQISDVFFRYEWRKLGLALPARGAYAVGMVFLPKAEASRAYLEQLLRVTAEERGLGFAGLRSVPVDPAQLGEAAKKTEPAVVQVVLAGKGGAPSELELFRYRKAVERAVQAKGKALPDLARFYFASLSAETIVYKGMLLPERLGAYYQDLREPLLDSALALVHSRFSTNTFPSWRLAQPFRRLCHNGEINTLTGNLAGIRVRERAFAESLLGPDAGEILPLVDGNQSDSACLDNAAEAFALSGRSLSETLLALLPEAWEKNSWLGAKAKAFFEYQSTQIEPWDGPAALGFMTGRAAGVLLDRNGLRPCRYLVSRDGLFVAASEMGALPLAARDIESSGRVGPGQMLVLDLDRKRLVFDKELKETAGSAADYRRWLEGHVVNLDGRRAPVALEAETASTAALVAFGYTREDVKLVLDVMAETGKEPVSSMGDDLPPAILGNGDRPLYDYFRQRFAQVTNPPIDPLREDLVMSLTSLLGPRGWPSRPLLPTGKVVKLKAPVLDRSALGRLKGLRDPRFRLVPMSLLFRAASGDDGFAAALDRLADAAEASVRQGASALLLSDRGVDAEWAALPALLAVAAVTQHLSQRGLGHLASLVVETGEARGVHHFACLLGYGAGAVHPYLALAGLNEAQEERFLKASHDGLKKVFSKMGISTLASYVGAQTFEVLGLGPTVMKPYFPGTASPLGGATLADLAQDTLRRHQAAFGSNAGTTLPLGGRVHFRQQGERRGWSPEAIAELQHAATRDDAQAFARFEAEADAAFSPPRALRHLLAWARPAAPLPDAEVEEVTTIVRRFTTGAMSLGAISREAHEALAVAMNRIGAKSNSGEGGEDPARFQAPPSGVSRSSAIKQIASGRFGVTTHFLVNARELQIKIAQGAKPGEGGQLPGHKVDAYIASLRCSTPGVQLISPPPHHDIYSIEDLAQLILDLKTVHPEATVSVKLVATTGIGAIASGVAKAGADKIVISGDGGGTGAAPLSSILHAGMPWELGLAETHQTLVIQRLRDRVRLETDGQLKTGRDVVVAAILGADEFGFATAPLIAAGCVMMRQCHLNTCPVGIATQDPELRARFQGTPEHVLNYFFLVAASVRRHLAALGVPSLAAVMGRTELLVSRPLAPGARAARLDLAPLLYRPFAERESSRGFRSTPAPKISAFDRRIFDHLQPLVDDGRAVELHRSLTTAERTVGAHAAGELTRHFGAAGVVADGFRLACNGYAGQSFGAFVTPGMTLTLAGFANDYAGKGLSGGVVAIRPPDGLAVAEKSPVLVGNTTLYGATSGEFFVAGAAGERFGVRNSGAHAVVEGLGDHGCEYMTGGIVVVLGMTGRNFGAGMSGGTAFVFDEDGFFNLRCNLELVELDRLIAEPRSADARSLRALIQRHFDLTRSPRARSLLNTWPMVLTRFVKVQPRSVQVVAERRPAVKIRDVAMPLPFRSREVTQHV